MSADCAEQPPVPDHREIEIEDTATSRVADAVANEATDALIDQAEADPIRPGEPADAGRLGG